jgi:hypothetical protein
MKNIRNATSCVEYVGIIFVVSINTVFCPEHVYINPLNAKLNPICHLLALLRAHTILHVSRIRVKQVS